MYRSVPATEAPRVIEKMLRAYLKHRIGPEEAFNEFIKRHPTDELKAWFEEARSVST